MEKVIKIIIAILFLSSQIAFGQQEKQNVEMVFTKAEKMPQFPGGDDILFSFISSNLKYPEAAKQQGIEGKVYVTFVIDKTGKVKDAKILRGISEACDKEVLRVMSIMPDWTPGMQDGTPVNVQFNLPVAFSLQIKDNKNK